MALTVIETGPEEPFAARIIAPLPLRPALDVTVPVFNEDADLARSVRRLHRFLEERFPFSARITIADSAGTNATAAVSDALAAELANVRVLHLNRRGRGRALAAAWLTSEARVVACMDVDLATDLDALLPLVAPVLTGHSEIVIGAGGFRAVRADVARRLVPRVLDRGRFFATELVLRAKLGGIRGAGRLHK